MFELFTTKFDKMQNLLTSLEDKKLQQSLPKRQFWRTRWKIICFAERLKVKLWQKKILHSGANNWVFLPKDAKVLKNSLNYWDDLKITGTTEPQTCPHSFLCPAFALILSERTSQRTGILTEFRCWGSSCRYTAISLHCHYELPKI